MKTEDLADLYIRFWKWYGNNVSSIDIVTLKNDVEGKTRDQILQKFKDRKKTIRSLASKNYYQSGILSLLKPLNSDSAEELSIKLTIRGY